MAKKGKVLIKLVSTGGSGHFYVKKKNPKSQKKISLRKFDPVLRKHFVYKEEKYK